jgi:uncharacterized protein YciI
MPYTIQFTDSPQTTRQQKADLRNIHLEYVMSNADRIIASGGFFPDNDDFPDGGLIILNVETRAEAVKYIESDPFFINGLFTEYKIIRWKKFIFNHQRV